MTPQGGKATKVTTTHPRRTFARTSDLVCPWIRAKFLAHGPSVSSSSSSPDSPGGPSTAARQLRVGRSHRGISRIFAGLSVVRMLARHSVRIKCKFRGPVGIDIRPWRNCNCWYKVTTYGTVPIPVELKKTPTRVRGVV